MHTLTDTMTKAVRRHGGALLNTLTAGASSVLGEDRWYAMRKTARHMIEARTAFADWPLAMSQILAGPLRGDFVASTRDGARLVCPNRPAARAPLYNIFAEDWYPLPVFARTMPMDCVVFDLGAHVGAFTVALASQRTDVRVFSLEAARSSHAYLLRNIAMNGLSDRVTALLGAAWGRSGQIEFQDNGAASCINSVIDTYASEYLTDVPSAAVPAMTAADLFARADGETIGLVKVDCEGSEYDFILRSRPEDWRAVQQVHLEYHPSDQHTVDDLVRWFAGAGLHVVKLAPTRFGMGDVWLARESTGLLRKAG